VKYVGTRILAGSVRFPEARDTRHKHACVNNDPSLALPTFLR
jgi:hypothetical protein